jgi:hypothetical protein
VFDEVARVLRPPDLEQGEPGEACVVFDLRRDLALPFWLLVWFATRVVVPPALRRANEPLATRDASYTPGEAGSSGRSVSAHRLARYHRATVADRRGTQRIAVPRSRTNLSGKVSNARNLGVRPAYRILG